MKKTDNGAGAAIARASSMKYALVLEGVLVGALAGAVAIVYRIALDWGEKLLRLILSAAQNHPWAMAGWLCALAGMALLVGLLLKAEPLISGSGIPQVEGEMQGYLDSNPLRVMLCKLAGGVLCILGGLSLGREGPSIQLGAMTGKGVSRILGRAAVEEKHLLTCGASAGLAAAFNAPLAGIMFALEEVHKSFSLTVLFSVMTASVMADFVSKNVFGLSPVFHFTIESMLPLRHYWLLLILGLLLGAGGALYNKAILLTQDAYGRLRRLPDWMRPVIPFVLAGVLGFTLPQVLGGGHTMIELLTGGRLLLGGMLVLLAAKFLFSIISFGSGAPGGIFFPLLVLGAFVGGSFGAAAIPLAGLNPDFLINFIIVAMAGFFAAVVRAPITGIVLISEMCGSLQHLLSLSVVALVAYVTADLLRSTPIYDSLLERLLRRRGISPRQGEGKVLLEAVICHGAALDGVTVSQAPLPEKCLLVAVRRGEAELIPRGDTPLSAGDTVVALAPQSQSPEIGEALSQAARHLP